MLMTHALRVQQVMVEDLPHEVEIRIVAVGTLRSGIRNLLVYQHRNLGLKAPAEFLVDVVIGDTHYYVYDSDETGTYLFTPEGVMPGSLKEHCKYLIREEDRYEREHDPVAYQRKLDELVALAVRYSATGSLEGAGAPADSGA